jgi:hypothetical protein
MSTNVIPTGASKLAVERLIVIASYDYRIALCKKIDHRRFHLVKILELVDENKLVCWDGGLVCS